MDILVDGRNVYFTGNVTEERVHKLYFEISKLINADDLEEKTKKTHAREPINLHISSYGGECYTGFGIIDLIVSSKTPIRTYGNGKCMSMGAKMLIAGHKRFAHKNTTIMLHDISNVTRGFLNEIKQETAEMERLRELLVGFVCDRTKVKEREFMDLIEKNKNWYISPEEALRLNIIHEII